MSRIIGVTVGTPTSPAAMEEKIRPVKSVNGNYPDEIGNVEIDVPGGSDANVTAENIEAALGYKPGQDAMYVNVTHTGDKWTLGNTLAEIEAAYAAGRPVFLVYGSSTMAGETHYLYLIQRVSATDWIFGGHLIINNMFVQVRLSSSGNTETLTTLAKKTDIPTVPSSLKNPYPLTINGTEYDGSKKVEMTIEGGGSKIHVGNEPPDDPEATFYIDTDDDPDEGGSSIDVTAEVGQTIVVEAVDGNGTPTKWKAVDFPEAAQSDWNAAAGEPGHILNRTHWVENEGKKTLFDATVTTSGNMAYIAMDGELKAGQTYTVTFQGTQFECVAKYGMFNGTLLCVYIGNPYPITGEYSTELFTILWVPHMGVTGVAVLLNDGSYPIKIEGDVITHHTISPKLLPKPIWLIDIDYDAETQSVDVSPIELNLALDSGELVALRAKRSINASLSIFHFTVRGQDGILEFDSPRSGSSVKYSRWLVPNASGGYDVTATYT